MSIRNYEDNMKDGKRKIGKVNSVEMEIMKKEIDKVNKMIGGNWRREEMMSLRIVIKKVEKLGKKWRNMGWRKRKEIEKMIEIMKRKKERKDRNIDEWKE